MYFSNDSLTYWKATMVFKTTSLSLTILVFRSRLISLQNEDRQSGRAEDLELESHSILRKIRVDSLFGKVWKCQLI